MHGNWVRKPVKEECEIKSGGGYRRRGSKCGWERWVLFSGIMGVFFVEVEVVLSR